MIKMGCFGSVVAFNPKGEVCANCPVNNDCATIAFSREEKTLRKIELHETKRTNDSATIFNRSYHNIDDIPEAAYHKVKRYFLRRFRYYQNKKTGKHATRAEKDYDAMVKNKINFALIKQRENPFSNDADGHYAYMFHVVNCLLDYEYVASRDVANYLGQSGIGTTKSSQTTMANRAMKILSLADIVKNDGGIYCLL